MAIKNKAVEIRGADAKVIAMQIIPQPDGKIGILVTGQTVDSDGRPVALKDARILYAPGANDAMNDLLRGGLDALRKTNDLEDGPVTLEPILAAVAAEPVRAEPTPEPEPPEPAPEP